MIIFEKIYKGFKKYAAAYSDFEEATMKIHNKKVKDLPEKWNGIMKVTIAYFGED